MIRIYLANPLWDLLTFFIRYKRMGKLYNIRILFVRILWTRGWDPKKILEKEDVV